jgi:uncharacterized protein YdbL (DUF1318 family)
MVVHAIFEGAEEIGIYGVDLLQDEEYAYQRPGCEYWIGVARGLGIKVHVPRSCAVLKASYVYGYTEPPTTAGSMQGLIDFFAKQQGKLDASQQQLAAMVNTVQGCRQTFGFISPKLVEILQAVNTSKADAVKAVEALEAEIAKQQADLEAKFNTGLDSLKKMAAQREFAQSATAWTGHYARGGKLEGMA